MDKLPEKFFNNEDENLHLRIKQIRTPRSNHINKIRKIIKYLIVFLIVCFFTFSYKVIFSEEGVINSDNKILSFIGQLRSIINPNKEIQGEDNQRINLLLLGIGGAGHDGPYLSDTIIIASFDLQNKKIALLSIPRDLVVNIPGYGWRKANAASAYGEESNPDDPTKLARETLSKTFQIDLPYAVRVDFDAFRETIDDLNGVKINVENWFIDEKYPADDYKYQTMEFKKGWQIMDGETALKFARSRHGLCPDNPYCGEGSDFGRSKRQQLVIKAAKDKILSINTILNPSQIKKIIKGLDEHITTNLEMWEIVRLGQLGQEVDSYNIINYALENGPDGDLENFIGEDGAYFLQPKNGDYGALQKIAQNIFDYQTVKEEIKKAEQIKKYAEEKTQVKIIVLNGTAITGFASATASDLKTKGFLIYTVGNAPTKDYTANIIYDLTGGKDKKSAEALKTAIAGQIALENPSWTANYLKSTDNDPLDSPPSFIIVMGDKPTENNSNNNTNH